MDVTSGQPLLIMGAGTQVRIGAYYGLTASAGTVTSINRSSGSNGDPGAANVPQCSPREFLPERPL